MNPYSLLTIGQNNFSGNSNVNSQSSTLAWLTQPYQFNSSGTLPGATIINIGKNITLNGSTGTITVTNPATSSSVGIGPIPGSTTDFGLFVKDGSGNLLMKIVGSTIYAYDITQSPVTNVIQILKLPNGQYGMAVAKIGDNVASAF